MLTSLLGARRAAWCCVIASGPERPLAFCIAAIFRSVMIFLDVPGPAADVTKLLAFLLLRLAVIDCEDAAAAAAASRVCEKGRRPLPI